MNFRFVKKGTKVFLISFGNPIDEKSVSVHPGAMYNTESHGGYCFDIYGEKGYQFIFDERWISAVKELCSKKVPIDKKPAAIDYFRRVREGVSPHEPWEGAAQDAKKLSWHPRVSYDAFVAMNVQEQQRELSGYLAQQLGFDKYENKL